jgi:exonuclease III
MWNATSMRNKTDTLCDYILDKDIDIMCICESWAKSDDSVVISECTPPGYECLNITRGSQNYGGGIAVIYKSPLKLSLTKIEFKPSTFEFACISDSLNQFRLFVVYRPPPSKKNGLKTTCFLSEFDEFLDEITLLSGKLLVVGDFNLHLDKPNKPEVAKFFGFSKGCWPYSAC